MTVPPLIDKFLNWYYPFSIVEEPKIKGKEDLEILKRDNY